MVVLVYLTLVPLECYSWSTDVIIKTKLTRDRNKCMEVFCKKDIFKNLKKFTEKQKTTKILRALTLIAEYLWTTAFL